MTKEIRAKFRQSNDALMKDIAAVMKKHGLEGEPSGLRVAFTGGSGGCEPPKIPQMSITTDQNGNIQFRTICQ